MRYDNAVHGNMIGFAYKPGDKGNSIGVFWGLTEKGFIFFAREDMHKFEVSEWELGSKI